VLTLVCLYVLRDSPNSPITIAALGLIAGGGLGNWLDRLLNAGAVTDFVSLGVGRLRTGIFNVADLAVVAGTVLLLLSLRHSEDPPEEAPE
jgi:signal peptidase II